MNNEEIKINHSNSWKKLWKIYNKDNSGYKGIMLWVSITLNLIIIIYSALGKVDPFSLLEKYVVLYIEIIPSLLGFNLGAYALLIGLASTSFLNKMTKGINEGYTFFQRASSIFGFCIAVQAVSLIFSFIVKEFIEIQNIKNFSAPYIFSNDEACIFNYIVLFIINFVGIYSITLVLMIIKNIFGISQTANFFNGLENLRNEDTHRKN